MAARIMAGLVGLMMGLSAIGWLTDPASAAAGLGMPLLDGIGRSTQVGDFTAFFVTASVLAIYGAIRQETPWLIAPALLLGGAAVFRTLAWLVHGAEFATAPIVVEVVLTALLIASVVLMNKARASEA
jgi:hypothetical protein